jgi:hypothetical protein
MDGNNEYIARRHPGQQFFQGFLAFGQPWVRASILAYYLFIIREMTVISGNSSSFIRGRY